MQIYLSGGYNASSYFYTIMEFDTVLETWLEVANMKSARGGPGVSVIDFNHVKDSATDCISGKLLYLKPILFKQIQLYLKGTIGDASRLTSSPRDLFIDWCSVEGCDANLQSGVTLRQKISQSSSEDVIMSMCAALKLNRDTQLEYTLIDCEKELRPLCLRGDRKDITITETAARYRKKRRRKKKEIYKLRQKQLLAKMLRKTFSKKIKRKRTKTKRQADTPPVEMCATAGKKSFCDLQNWMIHPQVPLL